MDDAFSTKKYVEFIVKTSSSTNNEKSFALIALGIYNLAAAITKEVEAYTSQREEDRKKKNGID